MPPRPGELQRLAESFRLAMLRQDAAVLQQLVNRYSLVWRRVRRQVEEAAARIVAETAVAGEPSRAAIGAHRRMRAVQAAVEAELRGFAAHADLAITRAQREAVRAALDHSIELTRLAAGGPNLRVEFDLVHVEATRDLIGVLGDGSPLARLLDELPGQAGRKLADEMVSGIASGTNPRRVVRLARDALGSSLSRGLTIARTEMLRSYRTASHRQYRAAGDVLRGWMWLCAQTTRTCASCWAMDGTIHRLDETLDDHPRGRCTPVPVPKDGGIEGERPTGVEAFSRLPEGDQLRILGPSKHDAYRAGRIELPDLVRRTRSPVWGTTRSEASLRTALRRAAARSGRLRS